MRIRFPLAGLCAAVAAALAMVLVMVPVMAVPAAAEPGSWIEPPAKLPKARKGDPTKNINFLFEALKLAPDETTAKAIEARIWALWFNSHSDTADLLMTRARTALEAKETDLALELLGAIVKIKPDFVEAWNRRATIHFSKKDYGAALADIREVLRREPRHFGALSGLGMMMQELGDDARALDAFRRAVEVHPRIQRIPELVKQLKEKVEGRDI